METLITFILISNLSNNVKTPSNLELQNLGESDWLDVILNLFQFLY